MVGIHFDFYEFTPFRIPGFGTVTKLSQYSVLSATLLNDGPHKYCTT